MIVFLDLLLVLLSGTADPVTVMGENLLPKTDLVVTGESRGESRVGLGARVTSFEVTEVILGRERSRRILVLSPDPEFLGPAGVPCAVFLKRLGEGRYEGIGRIDVHGPDGKDKLAMLRRYLKIEALADRDEAREALKDLLLSNLGSDRPFLVFSAARELAHFTKPNAKLFGEEDLVLLSRRADETRDPELRELLLAAVRNLGGQPEGRAPEAAAPGVPVDRRGIPAPHEFREMLAAWREGVESPDERLRIVRAAVARHVKYAREILLAGLEDEDPRVREASATGLGEGLFDEGRDPLRRLLATEKDGAVLKAAMQSLGFLGAEEALPAILHLGKDPDLVRTSAFAAARIGGPLARDWLGTLRTMHAGDAPEDRRMVRTLDFLESEDFEKQEEALRKIRERRLR